MILAAILVNTAKEGQAMDGIIGSAATESHQTKPALQFTGRAVMYSAITTPVQFLLGAKTVCFKRFRHHSILRRSKSEFAQEVIDSKCYVRVWESLWDCYDIFVIFIKSPLRSHTPKCRQRSAVLPVLFSDHSRFC